LELGAIIPYTAYSQYNYVVDFPGVIALEHTHFHRYFHPLPNDIDFNESSGVGQRMLTQINDFLIGISLLQSGNIVFAEKFGKNVYELSSLT
jgi:hypothetical protein